MDRVEKKTALSELGMEVRVLIRVGSRDADWFRLEAGLLFCWRSSEMILGLDLVGLSQVGFELTGSLCAGSLSRERESGRSCSEMEEWHWREVVEVMEVNLGKKDLEGRKEGTAIVDGERVERGGAMEGCSIHYEKEAIE